MRKKAIKETEISAENQANMLSLQDLKVKSMAELMELAEQYQIENSSSLRKQELVFALLQACISKNGALLGDGVLEILADGFGFLRSPLSSYMPGADDIYVSPAQIRQFNLRRGDTITGLVRPPRDGEHYFNLMKINEVNFEPPENSRNTLLFDNLTPIYPEEQFIMSTDDKNFSGRIIDLMSPIGRGQRSIIVAPPRTGKTILMQNIANAINANHPEVKLIILLIEERPE